MNEFHDVIVIGAGPGGSTTATLLAQRGLDVLLLDKSEFPRDKTCGDALSPRALKVAAGLGLADELHNLGYRIDGLSATGPSGERVDLPLPQHEEYPAHGLVVRRVQLDDLIRRSALSAGAKFQAGARVTDIGERADGVVVQIETRKGKFSVRSQVAVIAVGANLSLLRKLYLLPNRVELSLAARRYYQNLPALDHNIHIRFDGIPLPGYGWIFPLSEHEANIGAGFTLGSQSSPASAPAALDTFLSHPPDSTSSCHRPSNQFDQRVPTSNRLSSHPNLPRPDGSGWRSRRIGKPLYRRRNRLRAGIRRAGSFLTR